MSRSRVAGGEATATALHESAPAPPALALALQAALLVLFFTYWCVDIVSPALPLMRDSLALSATGAGMVFSIFFAGRLVTNLPAAWLVERAGPKWTAVAGAAALLAGSALAASATSLPALLPARGVQGAGVAILATAGLLSVLRALPGGGAAMTAFNVSSGLGGASGLLIGGYLAAQLGWRAVFWLTTVVAAVILVCVLLFRPRSAVARAAPGGDRTSMIEGRAVRAGMAAAIAANLLVFANYAIWVVSLPLLVAGKFAFNPEQVGLLLLYVNVVHLVSAMPFGRIIRVSGATRALAAGFGIAGAGLLLAPLAPSAPWLLAPLALYAIGQVAGNSAAGDLILRLGGGGGRAVGAVRLSSDVGMVAGPAAAGALADAAGVQAPFVALGTLSVLAMLTVAAARVRGVVP